MEKFSNNPQNPNEPDAPEVVYQEPDDKPSGRGVMWSIIIAVIVLVLIYFFFFMDRGRDNLAPEQPIPTDTVAF